MRAIVDLQPLSLRRHELGPEQTVAAHAVGAREPAETAAEGQPSNADGRGVSPGCPEIIRPRCRVDLSPLGAGPDAGDAPLRIDLNGAHLAQIDDDPSLAHTVAD